MVRSDVEIPRIELLCFLELDSQKWWCTEFRGNFYKVIFFFLLPIFSALGQREVGDPPGAAWARRSGLLFSCWFILKVKEQSCWEARACVLAALKLLRTGSCAGCASGLRGLCADLSPHHLRFFSTLATSALIYFKDWRDCRCCRELLDVSWTKFKRPETCTKRKRKHNRKWRNSVARVWCGHVLFVSAHFSQVGQRFDSLHVPLRAEDGVDFVNFNR